VPLEFEMTHQARVGIDLLRFAIKDVEQFGPHTDQMRDAGLQLLRRAGRVKVLLHGVKCCP